MPRIRTIKAEFFTNEELGACSMAARLLAIGLLNHADSAGRLEDRPARLKVLLFPFDEVNIDALLIELADAGYLIRYTGEGKRCLQIVNFIKHQRPHPKEPASCLPAPAVKKNGKPCKKIQESSSSIIHYPLKDPSPDPDPEGQSEGKQFDEFYAQYPRHVAKEAAQKAWGKLTPSEREQAVLDVSRRKAGEWSNKEPQYVPHPATYLNGRRWTDEVAPAARAGPRLSEGRKGLWDNIERLERANGSNGSTQNTVESIGYLEPPIDRRGGTG